jgi:hypothetical protein
MCFCERPEDNGAVSVQKKCLTDCSAYIHGCHGWRRRHSGAPARVQFRDSDAGAIARGFPDEFQLPNGFGEIWGLSRILRSCTSNFLHHIKAVKHSVFFILTILSAFQKKQDEAIG